MSLCHIFMDMNSLQQTLMRGYYVYILRLGTGQCKKRRAFEQVEVGGSSQLTRKCYSCNKFCNVNTK